MFELAIPSNRLLPALLLVFATSFVAAEDAPRFARDIQPILSDNCYQCHGPDEASREADLRLDTQAGLQNAIGDLKSVNDSELLARIHSDDADVVMPPPHSNRKLTETQRSLLTAWVEAGGQWEGHWAYERPERPATPAISHAGVGDADTSEAINAIDLFISSRLQSEGLALSKPARREKRLRRLTLDLTGLPPTLRELDEFLADRSPQAWHNVVERLLASPRFGERMAMEWLDAARYADTNGYQGDRERTMWPWRDWVVRSLNDNVPFDEFTVWQLAGDLLPNATDEQKLATGFCRNHMINGEGGRIAEENRVEYVFDQIETMGTIWMGMTVQCCRCHDHKFDPITQAEYYKLFAFFNQTPVNGGGGDPQMAPNMSVPDLEQHMRIQQLSVDLKTAASKLNQAEVDIATCDPPEAAKTALAKSIADRKDEEWKSILEHFSADRPSYVEVAKSWRQTQKELKSVRNAAPKVMIMQDMAADKRRKTFMLNKGLYNQKLDEVSAGTPMFLPKPQYKEANRLGIARWLVSPEHPLTARVTVNRIWQSFFGTGLVKTSDDFGLQGEKPSHPALLDWLAVELIESGWDTKHIVRLIANSATYQQSAAVNENLLDVDPENRLLARGPRRRMPAWMIRDHALSASGVLHGRMGGASVKPYQPEGIWAEASFGKKRYQPDTGEQLYRRSLYVYWRRIVGPTMFFDMSKRQTCSVRKGATNTPLHALVTLNDTTYVEAARIMATRVIRQASAPTDRLALAFRLATSRMPDDDELDLLGSRLQEVKAHFAANREAAEQLVGVGDMAVGRETNHSELAAWTTTCLLMLNLDEALNK